MQKAESLIRELLAIAGVEINGSRPWDIAVHNPQLYPRILRDGVLGLGEGYMDDWWDCVAVDQFIARVLTSGLEYKIKPWKLVLPVVKEKLLDLQNRKRASKDVRSHYDRGDLLFHHMLDARMMYSCGYWKNASTLDEAQEAKLDLICRKLDLRPGMHILDIGCGWGGFLKFAAEKYGITGVGITLSENQCALGNKRCFGLPIEIRIQDYRDVQSTFDAVVSIGMFEHVGPSNYRTFMQKASSVLEREGLFLLHTIGSNIPGNSTDLFTQRHIFPGSYLPAIEQIGAASRELFVMEDWHNFGDDYAKTLLAWLANFNSNWEPVLAQHYDRRFYRMWTYMLQMYAGAFRARRNQLWQIVFSKTGVPGGYISVR